MTTMSCDKVKRTSRKIPVRTSQFSPHHGMSTLMSRQFFSLPFSDFSCCYIGHIFDSLMDQISRSGGRLNGLKWAKQQQSAEESAEGIQSSLFLPSSSSPAVTSVVFETSKEFLITRNEHFSTRRIRKNVDKRRAVLFRVSGRRKKPGGEKGTKKYEARTKKSHFLCVFFAWVLVCWCLPSACDGKGGVNEMKVDYEVEMMREEKDPF